MLYALLTSPMSATRPAHLILFDLMSLNNIWWRGQIKKLLIL